MPKVNKRATSYRIIGWIGIVTGSIEGMSMLALEPHRLDRAWWWQSIGGATLLSALVVALGVWSLKLANRE